MSNYKNLPGVNIDVKDGEMLITEDNTSNSMLIIGTALGRRKKGSAEEIEIPEEIMFVPSEDVLFENYGAYFRDGRLNPIAAEWKVAKENGVSNIYLLGLAEQDPKKRYVDLQRIIFNELPDYQISHIVVTGIYADEDITGLTASDFGTQDLSQIEGLDVFHVVKGTDVITPPEGSVDKKLIVTVDGVEATATLSEEKSTDLEYVKYAEREIRKAIAETGLDVQVYIDLDKETRYPLIKSTEEVGLSGTALGDFNISEQYDSTIQGFGNIASMLGDYAERQTLETGAVIVYIATKPVTTTNKKEIREKVVELTSRNNEISKHVQVIAGPQVGERMPGSLRTQWMTGVTHYAVLVNSLAVQNAPTNQPLPGISNLRYDLSLRQLDSLTGNKYVTFRSKNNRIVVVDGVTTAPDIFSGQDVVHSDFRRLTTLRSTSYMVDAIRSVVDPFIGRPNEFPAYNAMNTAIRGVINTAVERGIIQDAAYSIELGDNLDVAKVDLTILPQFELRKIDVSIGLSLPGGFEPMSQ